MIVDENSAKKSLIGYGLQVPRGEIARSVDEALSITQRIKGPVVVKAIIPTGGRGKAGGVRHCSDKGQVIDAVKALLNSELLDFPVISVCVEAALPIRKELYAAVMVDTEAACTNLLFSHAGGIEVESQADDIRTISVDPGSDLPAHRLYKILKSNNNLPADEQILAFTLATLYRAAADFDALLLEVNPLAVLEDGSLAVLDCKLQVDDNALSRQPDFRALQRAGLSEKEQRAVDLSVSFVSLGGDIGLITSGAGLGMATLDLLALQGLEASNFLDTGGGISKEIVQHALELVMAPSRVRGAILNLYGGINSMVEAAEGILAASRGFSANRPIIVKIQGNQQEVAWDMLSGLPATHVVREVQTEKAVALLVRLLA